MTRIIAGTAGGQRIRTTPGSATRPTSDRVREALFSALESLRGSLDGARVLDLYAGSGAVGLEACSRGAVHALLVERDRRAASVIRANARALGLTQPEVAASPVERLVQDQPRRPPYDVAFLDPPYALADRTVAAVVAGLAANGWLGAGAVVVVERSRRGAEWRWPEPVIPVQGRRYGETMLWYGRYARATGEKEGHASGGMPRIV